MGFGRHQSPGLLHIPQSEMRKIFTPNCAPPGNTAASDFFPYRRPLGYRFMLATLIGSGGGGAGGFTRVSGANGAGGGGGGSATWVRGLYPCDALPEVLYLTVPYGGRGGAAGAAGGSNGVAAIITRLATLTSHLNKNAGSAGAVAAAATSSVGAAGGGQTIHTPATTNIEWGLNFMAGGLQASGIGNPATAGATTVGPTLTSITGLFTGGGSAGGGCALTVPSAGGIGPIYSTSPGLAFFNDAGLLDSAPGGAAGSDGPSGISVFWPHIAGSPGLGGGSSDAGTGGRGGNGGLGCGGGGGGAGATGGAGGDGGPGVIVLDFY